MASQPSRTGVISASSRKVQWDQEPLQYGEAIAVTLLLSDWDKFGVSERVCYHFDLIETLTASSEGLGGENEAEYERRNSERNISPSEDGVCGVASLLECVPKTVKYRRRDVRNAVLCFNMLAQQVRQEAKVACFEPSHLPLRLSPATRVSFAYEVTKVAFCLDASSTLVATFGDGLIGLDDEACCALDRLDEMTSCFFKSLVKPINAPWLANPKGWNPIIAVTVLAIYPNETGPSDTSILVRDFRVHDDTSAERLSKEIAQWALTEVEGEIANRMGRTRKGGIDSWSRTTPSSSLRDIFDAGDVALSLLPSRARPCIVLATDCRSVACESILDLFQDPERVDTPLVVLDLSNESSHAPEPSITQAVRDMSFLSHDPGNSLNFPLHLSDDSESLFGVCQATGGAFFNTELLTEASHTFAGKVPGKSPIAADSYFAFKRRALHPNAVQWYTLFSFSPLSPCLHPSWGKLSPPAYIRERMRMIGGKQELETRTSFGSSKSADVSTRSSFNVERQQSAALDRTVFSIYPVSPVRVKGLLLMRIKEGYRAKQYGSSTQDPDKVSIQFKLPLEFGIVLHYELSYKALDTQSPFVGVANVKIELSGEKNFIQAVKNDFISNNVPVQKGRVSTIAMRASAKLCKVLRGMRREDCLQAYLCPLSWADKLSSSDSPFARRLGTLSRLQRRRHFRLDQFDVLCVGRVPYEQGDYLILGEFIDFDSGEEELFDSLSSWATKTIKEKKRYVKKTSSSRDDLVAYCVIEVTRSGTTSRIFTVTVETFGGSSAVDRLALLSSLKEAMSGSKDVIVLPKPMNEYLVGLRDPLSPELKLLRKQRFLESHFHYQSWSGGSNTELLALLTKRRNEVGKFWFLHSSETYSLFAKLVTDDGGKLVTADFTKSSDSASSELYQVQYQIAVVSGSIVIDMHVEREQGVFFTQSSHTTRFHELFQRVRVRDQECGRALSSRTSLLSLLSNETSAADQRSNVERMLKYASVLSRKLRFFHSGAAVANKVLKELTVQLMLSSSSNIQVRRLPLDTDVNVRDIGHGIWFLIQFDGHTMGFAHLASSERQEGASDAHESFMFRELTFFSIGVSDLYCKRDLIADADDDSADDHISEYMCVSEFADAIEECHGRNYARAAYLALRADGGKAEMVSFDSTDFQYAVGHCSFSEFKAITLTPEAENTESRSIDFNLLSRTITDALTPVPGDKYCLFFSGDEEESPVEIYAEDIDDIEDEHESRSSDGEVEFEFSGDGTETGEHYLIEAQEAVSSHGLSLSSDGSETRFASLDIVPPIYVRFLLDDELVSLDEITRVSETAVLKAQISLFDTLGIDANQHLDDLDPARVPEAHYAVALRIRSLLDSYVAERTLERFRQNGRSVSRTDLRTVKLSLQRARHVRSSDVIMSFYDSKSDSMVRPVVASRVDTTVEQALPLLCSELQKDESIHLSPTSTTGFYVIDTVQDGSALSYWCFVTLKINEGVVNVKLYHPDGEWKAAEALSGVVDHIVRTMHRANQMLLLHSLHRNRIASSYLIPGSDEFDEWKSDEREGTLFTPGSFGCPVEFKTSFELYDRCVPSQVVLSLEASVLHSFEVSNRRGFFVYKDESDAIFYMKLKAIEGNDDGGDSVELLVYGLRHPGPSVTRQLTQLLQRRVHMLAVDALSTVLTKNPHLKWKVSDVAFLRSFHDFYQPADDEKDLSSFAHDIEYFVPDYVYDPLMLLVFFRQNICGSTFFHRLQKAVETGGSRRDETDPVVPTEGVGDEARTAVSFDPREFALFYNNAPSPLDPEFQPVCTLTAKGAEYSRTTGTGIAIIDVTLVDSEGRMVQELNVGQPPSETKGIAVSDDTSLRLHRVGSSSEPGGDESMPEYRIRVSVADTALDREALHSWVELTLNQVLIAWVVERHIERAQLGLLGHSRAVSGDELVRPSASLYSKERRAIMDNLQPGFPRLFDMLDASHKLPHPAIEKLDLGGVIKASSVATVALGLLEKCMNGLFQKEAHRSSALRPQQLLGTTIIRLSRSQPPVPVNLVWDSRREQAHATKLEDKDSYIKDSPIDCPEYLCFYCSNHYSNDDEDSEDTPSPFAMCFREVMVDDKSDGRNGVPFVDALLSLRERNPSAFSRSLLFVLSVKRNNRMLMSYNWNPQYLKSVTSQLRDANTVQRNLAYNSVHSLQKRCLQILAPPVTKHEPPGRKAEKSDTSTSMEKNEQTKPTRGGQGTKSTKPVAEIDRSGRPPRRIQRPTSIRRPKLIGKSVEGAAMHAMAASRARASATRGSSPFQKTIKSVPSKEEGGDPPPKANTASSITRVDPGDEEEKLGVRSSRRDDKASLAELASLLKRYLATMSLSSASPFHHARIIQTLTDKHWIVSPHPSLNPSVRDFLLTRSVHLWSSACIPFGFPDRMMENVSGYFAQWLNMSNSGFSLLQLDAPSQSGSALSPSSTVIAELKRIKHRKLCVALRTSLKYGASPSQEPSLRCDAWMLILARAGEDVQPAPTKLRQRRTVGSLEREATLVDKKVFDFARTMNIETQFFSFASFLIEKSLQPRKESFSPAEMLSLQLDMIKRCPFERQLKMDGLQYAAFEAPIVLASYEDKLINLFDSNKLFNHLSSDAASHDMIVCDLNGLCFTRTIPVEETTTTCFLTRDPRVIGRMLLVMTTRLEGRRMNEYVFRKGNPIGMQLFEAVAIAAAAAARDVLRAAASNIRLDSLWASFSSRATRRAPSKEELQELLSMVSSGPLANVDSRLPSMLFDPEKEYCLDWNKCCEAMAEDPLFFPHWSFVDEEKSAAQNVFYLSMFDEFLSLTVNKDGTLMEALLLWRDRDESDRDESTIMAGQAFANYLMHYLWHTTV